MSSFGFLRPSRGFASTKAEAAEILDPLPPASVEFCRRLPRGFVIRVGYSQDSDRGRFPMKHVRYSCSRETENHPRSGEMPHCRKVPERTCGVFTAPAGGSSRRVLACREEDSIECRPALARPGLPSGLRSLVSKKMGENLFKTSSER